MIGFQTLRACLIVLTPALALTACGGVFRSLPAPSAVEARVDALPPIRSGLERGVTVYWSDRMVPFVEAETDRDLAFTLGYVHAHLRLGQMEMFRRIAAGRISEMAGPFATEVDIGLRTIDYDRSIDEMEAAMPPETRQWVGSFVDGINHYIDNAEVLPAEFDLLGLEREPWSTRDLLRMGRLIATDVDWLVWFDVLPLRSREDWPEIWARLVENGSVPTGKRPPGTQMSMFLDVIGGMSRSGSNAMAVAGSRTATGGAIMASDPHLNLLVPNIWLVAGVKSPSLHAVGLMPPGLPVLAIGRNSEIGWSGTNLRASASDLVDVSGIPDDSVSERREEIGVRWWFDEDTVLRDSPWGPIVSDAPQFEGLADRDLALRWVGHDPSDEFTAMLKVARATDFASFRAAFDTYAVPAQNMLYGDRHGNVGMIMAARLPTRDDTPDDLVLGVEAAARNWDAVVNHTDLPVVFNPDAGYIASANNKPASSPYPVGYFFSSPDRVNRMGTLIEEQAPVTVDGLAAIQRDVYMGSSVALRDLLVAKIEEVGLIGKLSPEAARALALIRDWDGHYRVESAGALAFEAFQARFLQDYYELSLGKKDWAAFVGVDRQHIMIMEDISAATNGDLPNALRVGLERAAEMVDEYGAWGAVHLLRVQHPLGHVPLVGGRFRFQDLPVGGSSETIYKTAHGPVEDGPHQIRYGANARVITDLSDMDENYFVLLGGQDGWFNSAAFIDQLSLWQDGRYVHVPLRLESVRASFPYRSVFNP